MGAPVLIGAGIGAATSLATGGNPFRGALLGGVTGGAFGGAEGFGSGFGQGGLFDLGSGVASSAGVGGATNATAFGSAMAPSSALDVTAPAVQGSFGSAITPEYSPELLTNAYGMSDGANLYNIPDAYSGFQSAMQNPAIGGQPVQTFGLEQNVAPDNIMDTFYPQPGAGGYEPLTNVPTQQIYPDFTPSMGGEASIGGGYDPKVGLPGEKSLLDTIGDSSVGKFVEKNPTVITAPLEKALEPEQPMIDPSANVQKISKGELVDFNKTGSNILNVRRDKPIKQRPTFFTIKI